MKTWMLRLAVGALVLAAGVALGAGPLQHDAQQRDRDLDQARAGVARAQAQVADLNAAAEFATAYTDKTAPRLVAGKLTGRTVTLVTLPGADPDQLTALRTLLGAAGATVSAEASVEAATFAPSSRSLVEALTSQLVTQNPGLAVPASATGYQRLGALLARAVGGDRGAGPAGSAYDQAAVGIASGLQTAGLVKVTKSAARGQLVLVVAGPPAKSASDNPVGVALLQELGGRVPTVLAGTTASAGSGGVLGALRAQPPAAAVVSGVDSLESPMGRVAAVLALAERVGGKVDQYGAVDATGGPVPAS